MLVELVCLMFDNAHYNVMCNCRVTFLPYSTNNRHRHILQPFGYFRQQNFELGDVYYANYLVIVFPLCDMNVLEYKVMTRVITPYYILIIT